MTRRAILFDLDGTLVDSLRDIADATNRCLRSAGLPTHPQAAYRGFVGDGIAALVRRAVPDDVDPAPILAALRVEYAAHVLDETRPFEGIPALLAELRARDIALGVLSNKPHLLTTRVVETLFPATFEVVAGDRDGYPRKPDPTVALAACRQLGSSPAHCLIVGDTPVDVHTAHNAQMRAVAVTWGFRGADELTTAQPDALVHTVAQLHDHLRDHLHDRLPNELSDPRG